MESPTPKKPQPAIVVNIALTLVKSGEIIQQPFWSCSQVDDYAASVLAEHKRLMREYMLARHNECKHKHNYWLAIMLDLFGEPQG